MTSCRGFKVSNGVIAGQPFSNNGQTVLVGDSRETLQPAVSAAREEYTDIARSYSMSVYRDEHDNSNIWGVRLIMNGYSMPVDTSSPAYCYEQARQIADLTNGFRVSKGLSPLIWENEAADCAFLHSDDMARSNYYGHISPDGRSVAKDMSVNPIKPSMKISSAPPLKATASKWLTAGLTAQLSAPISFLRYTSIPESGLYAARPTATLLRSLSRMKSDGGIDYVKTPEYSHYYRG